MLHFMEKELAFESTERELESIIQKLEEQKLIHHAEGLAEEAGRRSLMQCLRTSLVNHPDDLRGRRRANKAREILINHVYNEKDFFFRLEEKFSRLGSQVAKCCLSDSAKRKTLKMASKLEIVLTLVWSAAVWFLDVYSDASVVYAVWLGMKKISDIKESDNTHWINLWKCNITHTEDLHTGLDILSGIFSHYFQAMLVVLLVATLQQIAKSGFWIASTKDKSVTPWEILKGICKSPVTIPKKMWKTRTGLKDPAKERENKIEGEFTLEIVDHRTRNVFKIVEA